MEIWCVRHGEATHNVDYRYRGEAAYLDPVHTNSALTVRGKGQASRCVLPCRPDLALTSPLRRAVDTAHIVMQAHPDVPLVTLDFLREFPNGKHMPNKLYRTQDTWREDREETRPELRRRVDELRRWAADNSHRYGKVVVFGHTSYFEELMGRVGQSLPHATPVSYSPRTP